MNYGKLKKGASLLLVLGIAARPFLFGAVPISAAESNNKDIGLMPGNRILTEIAWRIRK